MEEPPVQDREYYIENADCVIRVDNTIFKDMFRIPPDSQLGSAEGCSDENPIRLYGESADRFRALLSVLYDMAPQLQVYNTPVANVEQLLTIVEMTNKYHFASIETWAVDALHHVVSGLHGPPPTQLALGSCSSSWMKRLFELAFLCGHTTLLTYVAERWVDRIVARDLRPIHALESADMSSMRQLQGYAYYVQLLEMGDNFEPGVVEDGKQYSRDPTAFTSAGPNGTANGDPVTVDASMSAGTPATLTREQELRLLLGHWSLSRLWDNLRSNPPDLPQADGCTIHQKECVPSWSEAWHTLSKSEATLRYSTGDVLGRLRAMDKQTLMNRDIHEQLSALTPQCRWSLVTAFKTTIKKVEEGLADHFVGRTRTPEVLSTEDAS